MSLRLELGRVIKPVGLAGEFKLLLSEDYWPGILASECLALVSNGARRAVRVTGMRPTGRCAVLAVEGVSDRDAAEALLDAILVFEGEDLDVPAPEELHPFQVIGLEVRRSGGGRLGEVVDLEPMPAQPLLVVRGEGRDYRVPFVEPLVREWNAQEGWIEIDPPEGLLEL